MWSASFNAPGNRILSGILIFDLFRVRKSNSQAFPGFLRAGIEEIKTASAARLIKILGNQKLRTFAGFCPSGNQTNQRIQTRNLAAAVNAKFDGTD